MSNAYLLHLPVELLHYIFNYLDVQEISSVRRVCKKLYSITNTYDQHHLNINYESMFQLKYSTRWILPESIVSLAIDSHIDRSDLLWYTPKQYKNYVINSLLLSFDLHRFTRLRSLVMKNMRNSDIDILTQHLNINSLESLSIDLRVDGISKAAVFLNVILSQNRIRKLFFKNVELILDDILWPVNSRLEYLKVNVCWYKQYENILNNLTNLKTFVIDEWKRPHLTYTTALSICKCPSLLTSLTITKCTLPMKHIELLLSQTSSITHLKLISCHHAFDTIFDGYNWEQFILKKLPQLIHFEYFFSFMDTTNNYMERLNNLIASFETPFWLQNKHWFTICGYTFESHRFELYNTRIGVINSGNLIRFEKLAENNTYRFVRQSSIFDEKKVCILLIP